MSTSDSLRCRALRAGRIPRAERSVLFSLALLSTFLATTSGADELTRNGDFAGGMAEWSLFVATWDGAGAAANASVQEDGINVSIDAPGTAQWNIQWMQQNLSIRAGEEYRLRFEARSESPRQIEVSLGEDGNDYTDYYRGAFELTSEFQFFEAIFATDPHTDTKARLVCDLGLSTVDVEFRSISLLRVPSLAITAPEDSAVLVRKEETEIHWSATASNVVTLSYSVNDGSTWTTLAEAVPAAIGRYRWNVPNLAETSLSLRIEDAGHPEFFAMLSDLRLVNATDRLLLIDLDEGGTVQVSPQKENYAEGEAVQIEAIPAEGYWFSNWSGDLSHADSSILVTMHGLTRLTANFRPNLDLAAPQWEDAPSVRAGITRENPHFTRIIAFPITYASDGLGMSQSEIVQHYAGVAESYTANSRGLEVLDFRIFPEAIPISLSLAAVKAQYPAHQWNPAMPPPLEAMILEAIDARLATHPEGAAFDYRQADGIVLQIPETWGWDDGYLQHRLINLEGIYPYSRILHHEFSHFLGLPHESGWLPTTEDPGGAGMHQEYGRHRSRMSHLTLPYKAFLGWVEPDETLVPQAGQTYRIFAHDHADARGLLGLRVPRADGSTLWVEVMAHYTDGSGDPPEAWIRQAYGDPERPLYRTARLHSLDLLPPNDFIDPLPMHGVFRDSLSGLVFKAVARGGRNASQWVDIEVTAEVPEPIVTIPFADPTPWVDGIKESTWDAAAVLPLDNLLYEASSIDEADFSATAYLLQNGTYLFIFVEVRDSERKLDSGGYALIDDSIDLFFDGDRSADLGPDRSHSGYDGVNDFHVQFRLPSDIWVHGGAPAANALRDGTLHAMVDHGTHYTLEASFRMDTLQIPYLQRSGGSFGLEIRVTDDDPEPSVFWIVNRRSWWAKSDQAEFNPHMLGRVRFARKKISDAAYNVWISGYAEELSPADQLPDADPDEDGQANRIEYILANGNPVEPASRNWMQPVPAADGFTLTWTVREGVDPRVLQCLLTNGNPPFHWSDALLRENLTWSLEGQTLSVHLPADAAPVFLRWSADQ